MKQLLWIAMGGAAGAMARYGVSGWVYNVMGRHFPWGTLTVNVLGSFLMGFLFDLLTERWMVPPHIRSALLVGGLGAFTTFSTFSLETLNLVDRGEPLLALGNAMLSVVACVAAVWLGVWLARWV